MIMNKFIMIKTNSGVEMLINLANVSDISLFDTYATVSFITNQDYFVKISVEEYNRLKHALDNKWCLI